MEKESSSQEASTMLVLFFVYTTFYLLGEIYSTKPKPLLKPSLLLSAYQLFDEAWSIIVNVETWIQSQAFVFFYTENNVYV